MKCAMCGHPKLNPGAVDETIQVGMIKFTARVPGLVCPDCGEDYLSRETVKGIEKLVAEALAREGAGSSEAFRFMRKVVGLKAREVAALFGVTPETISRWENGERPPDPRGVKLLGALVVEHLAGRNDLLEYLRSLREEQLEQPTERRLTIPPQMSLQTV